MWSATRKHKQFSSDLGISTHALRVERDVHTEHNTNAGLISTHALRVERDVNNYNKDAVKRYISTHALRVERDLVSLENLAGRIISTHALRVERDLPF